ncbi:PD-(D/E)XK nuclease family protein [Thioalkalicoccus limnaeus]|uniref:PD-(D/E)XK nuclease family protein n=1 Tax=Thioalkalicoccus limnaeus TaxID=120681 RepID=A0ABV4BEV5_9GAMM
MASARAILVLIGLPGAGKTTIAQRLVARLGVRHVPIDDLRKVRVGAADIADELTRSASVGPLVFECSGASDDFEDILHHLGARGFQVRVALIEVSAEIALRRLATRAPRKDPKAGQSWAEHVDWVRCRLQLVPTDAEIDGERQEPDAAAEAAISAWLAPALAAAHDEPLPIPLTFSRLSTWQVCGREYASRYVQRMPPTAALPPIVEVGSAVHEALAWLFAPGAPQRTAAETLAMFDAALGCAPAGLPGAAHAWGRQLLADFHAEVYLGDRAETLAVEAEVTLPLAASLSLAGRLDRLARLPAGAIEVTEFKLRRTRHGSRPRIPELLQPAAYAAAVMSVQTTRVAFVRLHFLEQRQADRILLTETGAARVKLAVLRWVAALRRKGSAAHPGHHCRHCGYRLVCPESTAKTAAVSDSLATCLPD